jgi:hypothetical protein
VHPLIAARGAVQTRDYIDNDKSAFKDGVFRDDFEAWLKEFNDGKNDGIAAWDLDRVFRRTDNLERVIKAYCDAYLKQKRPKPVLWLPSMTLDLTDPDGQTIARMLVAVANQSSAKTVKRVTGVIFATHSLGLARTAADQIRTLTKPAGGTSKIRPYEENQDLVTLLGQLSFDSRPEMGFSKVLLVEGKTELRTLMQFLRLYEKEHEVLMVPLHGGDMIRGDSGQELTDLLRISNDVHYVIDSERLTSGAALESERQAFVDLCQRLNIPGLVLDRRALENYFTDRAVKRAFGPSAQALGPHDKLVKSSGAVWRKTDNWRAAFEMQRSELDSTDLGTFLDAL